MPTSNLWASPMSNGQQPPPDLGALAQLFYPSLAALGQFVEVRPGKLPNPYERLLDHQSHMTVTVEEFHGTRVNVEVLKYRLDGRHYARKILLRRQTDNQVVQFGLVRLDFSQVSDEVRSEIESRRTPLGRVLIEHKVLREVELAKLWEVTPGEDLRLLLGMQPGEKTYGRTAWIYCNGAPAVELLEIVAPTP